MAKMHSYDITNANQIKIFLNINELEAAIWEAIAMINSDDFFCWERGKSNSIPHVTSIMDEYIIAKGQAYVAMSRAPSWDKFGNNFININSIKAVQYVFKNYEKLQNYMINKWETIFQSYLLKSFYLICKQKNILHFLCNLWHLITFSNLNTLSIIVNLNNIIYNYHTSYTV